jgi:biofilm PGA synthesis N-glycosyltransferase PgaC
MLLAALFYLFIILGTINLIHFSLYLIGANIYDVQAFIRKAKKGPARKQPKPLVSVLIPAYNEEKVIKRCLQSVWNNTYRDVEIIVIDDGSKDKTSEKVREFINARSGVRVQAATNAGRARYTFKKQWRRDNMMVSRKIRLVRQSNHGKAAALNNGIRNYAKGELVMTLDADSLIHKKAISNAVKYFSDPNIAAVAANVRIIEERSVLGILQRFEHMIGYRSKKLYTVMNCELIIGGVASTYRRSVLKRFGAFDDDTATEDIGLSMKIASKGNKKYRLIYASDVAAMTEGVSDFRGLLSQRYRWKLGNLQNIFKYRWLLFNNDKKYSKSLTWYRVPMAFLGEIMLLLEPVALGYVVYVSVRFATGALLLSAYMAISLYLLMTIWPDEHMKFKEKIMASLYVPFLYFIFYVMNVVQVTSALRCIVDKKKITHLSKKDSTWESPKRVGRAASF